MAILISKNPVNKYLQYNGARHDNAAPNLVQLPRKTKFSIRIRCPFCEKTVRDNRIATMKNHVLTVHEPFRHFQSYEPWNRDSRF